MVRLVRLVMMVMVVVLVVVVRMVVCRPTVPVNDTRIPLNVFKGGV